VNDSAGNLYVAGSINGFTFDQKGIWEITPQGIATSLLPPTQGAGASSFNQYTNISGFTVDSAGNLYVSGFDYYDPTGGTTSSAGCWITEITPQGVESVLAGAAGTVGCGSADGTAAGAGFQFGTQSGMAIDNTGNLIVADTNNHAIRKITPQGVVTTLAGTSGVAGNADGTGAAASFKYPTGLATDGAGNVYVGDFGNDTIRKITPQGVVTTLAGTAGVAGSADGTGPAASFNGPMGLTMDSTGNVYVADAGNYTIRKITAQGIVTTIAGQAGVNGFATGPLPGVLSSTNVVSKSGTTLYTMAEHNLVVKITEAP